MCVNISAYFLHISAYLCAYSCIFRAFSCLFLAQICRRPGLLARPRAGVLAAHPSPPPPRGAGPHPCGRPIPPHPITPPLPTNTHPNKHTLVVIVKPLVQGHRRPSLHHHPSELAPQRGQHRPPARHPGLPQHPARPATFSIQKSAARGPLLRRAQPRLHPTSVPNRPGGCRPSPAQHALA